ncbi:pre-rRNA 2'-O-ribose RNA methyltransferase FTSJ3-like isoform X2 [Mytilus galloprovincialis]|uniref:pre-rRNA 2'-O-ribose RNA methyltransferase FTSJ3-like isoform X2 n=1 Tax=Mytilus galloprovincialis TaxID=29158 RepID=UPI003F7CCC17
MGKKSKTGKSRKDKFYKLAKETGYRARSAFKLIQLNRKYEFLQKSRVVIDLCAAPGGWLQVCSENTPVSSLILGVDLVSIRPIPNVTTFQEDITTDKCRQTLRKELHTWKADVVLNDGAPNVGKNWLHDAFTQVQLALQALKLATEFLKPGGWFVTKVFRSKDYNALLWVMQQLFKRVHATKPQASRNESAEIFVVCEKFLAPDKIDPKFVDPKYVFQELEMEPKQTISLIHPEKKKRQRDGYAEGDYTLFHTLNASEFIQSENYLELLAAANQVILDEDRIATHPASTEEVKHCLGDIKVLGKKELRSIINWRKRLKKDFNIEDKVDEPVKEEEVIEEKAEDSEEGEAELLKKIAVAEEEEKKALKRKIKKIRREKAKLRRKIDMKMIIPGDRHDFVDDIGMFSLQKIKNKTQLDNVEEGDTMIADEYAAEQDVEEDDLNAQQKKLTFDREDKEHLDSDLYSSGEEGEEEPEFEDMDDGDDEEIEGDLEAEDNDENPLLVKMEDRDQRTEKKLNSWFSKDVFADLVDDDHEDIELKTMANEYVKKGGKILDQKPSVKLAATDNKKSSETLTNGKPPSDSETKKQLVDSDDSGLSDDSDTESESSSDDNASDSDYDTSELYRKEKESRKKEKAQTKKDGFETVPVDSANIPKLNAVGLAIGAAMVTSRKRKRDIVDDGYHRFMYDDEGLPEWFVSDESKHTRRDLPVTKDEVQEYKMKMKDIDARPIKKVAEAKARKKQREGKRLDRARKRAEAVSDTVDINERDKMQQIKQIYKKAGLLSTKKKEIKYVVAKKGMGKRAARPSGHKGPYKVVDPRMKSDNKRQKAQDRKKGGGKGRKKK